MRTGHSLQTKLTLLFLISIIIPVGIVIVGLPSYYHKLISKEATELTQGTLTALTFNVDTYLDDLERLTITPYLNQDVMQALKLKANKRYTESSLYTQWISETSLTLTLPNYLKNTRQDILSTILLPFDGSVYITSAYYGNNHVLNYPFTEQTWYQRAIQEDGNVAFISTHPNDYAGTPATQQVFSVARLIKDPDSKQPLAVMMADADIDVLAKIIKKVPFHLQSIVVIVDETGNPLYSNRPVNEQILAQIREKRSTITDTNDSYMMVRQTITRSNWGIIVLLSNSAVNAQLSWIYVVGSLLAFGGLIVLLTLYFSIFKWMISPFKKMIKMMRRVQNGDLQARIAITGKDEVAQLGMVMNGMTEQLSRLIDREYKAQLNQRNAEYRALQSQIQPHFLYNTLNGFIALNRIGQTHKLENSILALSVMLRYTLEQSDWSTLKEEFHFIGNYCELQQMRFQEKLHVTIQLSHDLESLRIPKLLLQPLVENAIIHGIEPLDKAGHILILAEKVILSSREMLQLTVKDDGCGFDAEESKFVNSVGLLNVKERLRLAYSGAKFTLQSSPGEGTTVWIQIPIEECD